jgi:hypothetical protein
MSRTLLPPILKTVNFPNLVGLRESLSQLDEV